MCKIDELHSADQLHLEDMHSLRHQAKERSKRLQKRYSEPSQLRMHAQVHGSETDDRYEVGMVRLVYSTMRKIRESKDYDHVYKRNSWTDLAGDMRHSIRVCLKAQTFIRLLADGADEPPSPAWKEAPSVQKQRMWVELLRYVSEKTPNCGKAAAQLEDKASTTSSPFVPGIMRAAHASIA